MRPFVCPPEPGLDSSLASLVYCRPSRREFDRPADELFRHWQTSLGQLNGNPAIARRALAVSEQKGVVMKTGFRPARFFVPIAMVMAVSAGALLAQGRTEDTGGSLAGLTAEVRQLRLAVEESARRQTQTQAISIYLAAQQSRMVQLSTRLDAVRKELGAAEAASAQLASLATNMAGDLTRSMPPEERNETTGILRMFKDQAASAVEREQRIRQQETELLQALQVEETRWRDLIARLQQAVDR
jgi:hypothetical protein